MKLDRVDVNEITIQAVYIINCFMCNNQLHISAEVGAASDAAAMAASQGWHSYETADESCSVACPSCIKEAQANEEEREAEASA